VVLQNCSLHVNLQNIIDAFKKEGFGPVAVFRMSIKLGVARFKTPEQAKRALELKKIQINTDTTRPYTIYISHLNSARRFSSSSDRHDKDTHVSRNKHASSERRQHVHPVTQTQDNYISGYTSHTRDVPDTYSEQEHGAHSRHQSRPHSRTTSR
jgi:hypothetical protein